jgi:hypothetical protein
MAKPTRVIYRNAAHVLKNLLVFVDSDMLQLFVFALRPYRSNCST